MVTPPTTGCVHIKLAAYELCDRGRSLNLYELLISEVGVRLLSLQSWQMNLLNLEVGESPKPVPSAA